jgi:hypothetical protein
MVYNTTQHPPPHSHTLSVYTVHLVWEGGGGGDEVREKVEGQHYTRPWGQHFTSWVENTNLE